MITYRVFIRTWALLFLLLYGLNASSVSAQNTSAVTIPESRFYPAMHGYSSIPADSSVVVHSFETTPFITLGEYKEFMKSVSGSEELPDSLMPETSICNPTKYKKYLSGKKYEKYPALGISWKNAIEYCIWRTKKENPDSGIVFIYRLPYKTEWIQMAQYADSALTNFEINRHYAEWIMASFDESAFIFESLLNSAYSFEYLYFAKATDPQILRRMCIYGKSFISDDMYKMYGYSNQGYRDVGFRMVKEYVNVPGRKPSPVVLNDKIMQLYGVKH